MRQYNRADISMKSLSLNHWTDLTRDLVVEIFHRCRTAVDCMTSLPQSLTSSIFFNNNCRYTFLFCYHETEMNIEFGPL